jgi:hypothetical protein
MSVLAIDFEASCLPRHGRSYPIEVGIADRCGSRGWLIRPRPSWEGWDGSVEAEHLHGITLNRLFQEDHPVDVVANASGEAILCCRVKTDSHIGSYWLDTLATAVGSLPTVKIEHINLVLDEMRATRMVQDRKRKARSAVADAGR